MKAIFKFNDIDMVIKIKQSDKKQQKYDNIIYDINKQLHILLTRYKNLIEIHYKSHKWDKFKKISNEYELVFTSFYGIPNVSMYNSISRSFFKLWEILHDFDLCNTKSKIKALFVADGPGGFIEAFAKYRNDKYKIKGDDTLYGITLLSNDPSVPNWKISKSMIKDYNIRLLSGKDGTGSIYNLDNIKDFVEKIGSNSCELITADGGFDFSKDFNNQESQSLHLILCEVFIALQLQKKGGVFVLKIFDISHSETITMLFILYTLYQEVYIIKPHSSRPANSEKYIICKNFKNAKHSLLNYFKKCIKDKQSVLSDFIKVPIEFMEEVVYCNLNYVFLQILNIKKTLNSIDDINLDIKSIINCQKKYAQEYCKKYRI